MQLAEVRARRCFLPAGAGRSIVRGVIVPLGRLFGRALTGSKRCVNGAQYFHISFVAGWPGTREISRSGEFLEPRK
ncbi:unnamed protein product, partial [Nesidiocoris tenuis]